ncbi:DUF4419 domain-containing protein [Nannocystis sp. ILAH1]|uniref:DUF4419 domain-containing protein n=1 Tax=Nannocystis sp. ILAH1 TaxID=2996789 RepID=UPI002270F4B5|nr:DUF4419 domain-containing protein [Nannocystis sp. ILAH1]MCY0990426.1 DUF4419 domain-containing protein [Nannocystis sp. ILAH1]MCY0992830.1 DUF4419 domain-containing protein [Nannocystis sp. ILAH1]
MPVTFKICEVEPTTRSFSAASPSDAVAELVGGPAEACGADVDRLTPVQQNALLSAVWRAFGAHRPLVLTPDAVWLAIAQGFAAHMSVHAERLRGRFVRHAGRQKLVVRRDDFVKGSPANPWPEVFADFSAQIAGHIGRQRDLVVCDFSTTGPVERAASELVLMDAMQQYFDYHVSTLCGIPEITLGGSLDDWVRLRHKARALAEYELEWWIGTLVPLLDEFIAAFEGRPNLDLWAHIFKHRSASGAPDLRGWVQVFFPYLTDGGPQAKLRENPVLRAAKRGSAKRSQGGLEPWITDERMDPGCIPLGLARAPLSWNYLGEPHAMELLGGFVGIDEDPVTLALRPAIGWAVRDVAPADVLVRSEPRRVAEPTPQPSLILRIDRVRCRRGAAPEGRLLLMSDGLRFAPTGVARNWLSSALTDDDDDTLAPAIEQLDDAPGTGARFIAADAIAAIHVARAPTTLTLTLAKGGETLQFELPDFAVELRHWCEAMGRPWSM